MAKYTYQKDGDRYVIYQDEQVLKTPAGLKVTTLYKPLADRILLDLERYGMNYRSSHSILAWHFTMIDNFASMGRARVEHAMAASFLTHPDWTCREKHGSDWSCAFGNWSSRQEQLAYWLQRMTLMQLTAACCIANAYESLNVAFVLALILERSRGEERDKKLSYAASLLADTYLYGTYEEICSTFKTFELYSGIHMEQEGNVLDDIEIESDGGEEGLDIEDLSEYSVTAAQLKGRNFYHYTDCKIDDDQLAELPIGDLELDESDEDEDDEDDEDTELEEYLPDEFWVKRFYDAYDTNVCYLLYLVVNEDGSIEDSGCLEETTQGMGGGGFFFMVPGMEMEGDKSYDYASDPPDKILDDLRLLFEGRAIPPDFSFIGKRLPHKMIEKGGNGGSKTEYTYALQSAYRSAYTHMSIDTTENGVIESLSCSSYQSSGSGYGDMFSRPVCIGDRREEAMDMLLYLYDQYSAAELQD